MCNREKNCFIYFIRFVSRFYYSLLLLGFISGCGSVVGSLLPDESTEPVDPQQYQLLTRFAHISDAQIVDEESPARLTSFAQYSGSAWRPQEAYSVHLLDGMVRTINKIHVAQHSIDFVVHTGDATDNVQLNELRWFISALDGGLIDPSSGPDDRDPAAMPDPLLDPHHIFEAQGLYQNSVHGPAETIQWYNLFGNHDRFAVGVFPIVDFLGLRISPMPLNFLTGLIIPFNLNPIGRLSLSPISPANPGPPPVINLPIVVESNLDRRYVSNPEYIAAHLQSSTSPTGHGFDLQHPLQSWYSISPVPGLRLIALNSATPMIVKPTLIYSEGAISPQQLFFLKCELEKAQQNNEVVIVATHHPIDSLEPVLGTSLTAYSFQKLLNKYPCVKLHLAGHWHQNVVIDRGGYLEIITGSIIDAPQQGRVIEIWKRKLERESLLVPTDQLDIEIRYRMFSHLDDISPTDESSADLFDDPFMPLRRIAHDLANGMSQ